MATDWQAPTELPDLRRVGIIALDTETNDEGLRADRGSAGRGAADIVCGISVAYRAERRASARTISRCAIPTATTSIASRSSAG